MLKMMHLITWHFCDFMHYGVENDMSFHLALSWSVPNTKLHRGFPIALWSSVISASTFCLLHSVVAVLD
jgi:hypothetical protein